MNSSSMNSRSKEAKPKPGDSKRRITVNEPIRKASVKPNQSFVRLKDTYLPDKEKNVASHNFNKLIESQEDVTPKRFAIDKTVKENFDRLIDREESIQSLCPFPSVGSNLGRKQTSRNTMQNSLEDIMSKISLNVMQMSDVPFWRAAESNEPEKSDKQKQPQYIKIILRETDDIHIYEKPSVTVPKDSEEAALVEADNQLYEELTVGKKKIRRRVDSEAQTSKILLKTRDTNTEHTKTVSNSAFVSNYDMYDTYRDLEKSTASVEIEDKKTVQVTTYKVDGVDQFDELAQKPSFKLAVMLTQRVLAGNTFRQKQKRFRNMNKPDPLALEVKYKYLLEQLWVFPAQKDKDRRAVAAMDWCPRNGDLVAIAYGIYTFVPVKNQAVGYICIWSIKNPVNPERRFNFNVPVVSLQFSPFNPQLLAIGFYDGSVEVRDVTTDSDEPVAISQRSTSPGCQPITKICWISAGTDKASDQFLATSQNGSVTKYKVTRSPYLQGFQQILLDTVDGEPEGLPCSEPNKDLTRLEANRHPTALTMTLHPTKTDIYYILTDQGCMHKCSINHPHQHMELLKVHNGSVFAMQFSPWSSKLFLTCGSDWCIRIWMDGMLKPLIKLSNGIGAIHYAEWSKTHSTVIIGLTRKSVEVWDIRRNILQPVSVTPLTKSYFTTAKLSNCGRSLLVGDEAGQAFLLAFEQMPFQPFFQFKELEAAILKAVKSHPDLLEQVKSIGHFGYPNQK